MLSITFSSVLLIITIETTYWSRFMSSNMNWILYRFSAIAPSQPIIICSLFAYAYDTGFHLYYGIIRYISYVPSRVTSNDLDVENYNNTPYINKVIQMLNLGKYMLWSSTDGSMAYIFDVSLTTGPDSIMMNNGISLFSMIGTDREFLNTSTYTFDVYWHVY